MVDLLAGKEESSSSRCMPSANGDPIPGYRIWMLLVLFLVGYAFVKYGLLETWNYTGCDFEIFYAAAQKIRNGESPYPEDILLKKSDEEGAWGGYIYPALFARMLTPLTRLPPLHARHLYLFFCLVIYFVLLFPWRELRRGVTLKTLLVAALFLGWGPVIQNFRYAQSNFIPLFCFALAWRITSRTSFSTTGNQKSEWEPLAAGFLFGIGSMIKLTPLLVVPFVVIARKWFLLIGILAGVVTGLILSGLQENVQFFFQVLPSLSKLPEIHQTLSLPNLLDRVISFALGLETIRSGVGQGWISPGVLISLILYAMLLFRFWKYGSSLESGHLILLGCFLPTVFAGVWFHHYLTAVLPLAWAVEQKFKKGSGGSPYANSKRLTLLVLAVLPGFNFWWPTRTALDRICMGTGIDFPFWFVGGHLVAFVLLLPEFGSKDQHG